MTSVNTEVQSAIHRTAHVRLAKSINHSDRCAATLARCTQVHGQAENRVQRLRGAVQAAVEQQGRDLHQAAASGSSTVQIGRAEPGDAADLRAAVHAASVSSHALSMARQANEEALQAVRAAEADVEQATNQLLAQERARRADAVLAAHAMLVEAGRRLRGVVPDGVHSAPTFFPTSVQRALDLTPQRDDLNTPGHVLRGVGGRADGELITLRRTLLAGPVEETPEATPTAATA